MAKKHTLTATNVDGYENTGHVAVHPCKVILTDEQILDYGRSYARNITRELPDIKSRHRAALEPLEDRLREANETRDYLTAQLADIPDDTGFIEADQTPETARELARCLSELKGIEGEITLLKLEYKVASEKLQLENELYKLRIDLGYEMRDMTCTWWVNWDIGQKRLVRIDTGDVVLTKPLSPEERQMCLLDFDITEDARMEFAEEEG